jgi:hypothetical protein
MPEMLEAQDDSRTRIPMHVDEDPPMINWDFVRVTLRQMLYVMMGAFGWYILAHIINGILGLPGIFGFIATIWIPVSAFALAFGKRHGIPMERYLADKIIHRTGAQIYVPRDEDAHDFGAIDEYDWDEDE